MIKFINIMALISAAMLLLGGVGFLLSFAKLGNSESSKDPSKRAKTINAVAKFGLLLGVSGIFFGGFAPIAIILLIMEFFKVSFVMKKLAIIVYGVFYIIGIVVSARKKAIKDKQVLRGN